jgi:protein TonB
MSVIAGHSQDPFAFSTKQEPVSLRVGVGLLVVALHVALFGALVLWNRQADKLPLPEEPAVMVSVIEAPAPQVAKANPQPEPTPPAVQPPPEPEPEPQPEPVPQALEPTPQAPIVKPRPPVKPIVKPQQKPKPRAEPKPVQAEAPVQPQTPPSGAPEGADQTSQAPRQAEPVMVNSVEYDGARPMPVYPMASRMRREEGRVVVLVRISAQGRVEDARVDTSSGYSRLDDSALDAARRARFKPLMRNGVALPAMARLPFDFVMRN